MSYYIEKDGVPVPCDLDNWSRRFETTDRIVARTPLFDGRVTVSTVFLGLDHNFGGNDPPILYETMIFGGPLNDYQTRYCTRVQALAGHAEAVEAATKAGVSKEASE